MAPASQRVPPEIWEKIAQYVDRKDLAALAVTCRSTHPLSNIELYRQVEVSMCKCSESYFSKLNDTLCERSDLASVCTSLVVDISITCPVKASAALDSPARRLNRFLPVSIASQLRRQAIAPLDTKKATQECSTEGVDALRSDTFKKILQQLKNINSISIILGTFHQAPALSSSIFEALCNALPKVQRMELRDLALSLSPKIQLSMSSLRSIVLAYVSFSNSELWEVLSLNAAHLEELRLLWVKEIGDKHLFENCEGVSLKNLRVVEIQGITIPKASKAFQGLLGDCDFLQTFHLKSLTPPSAAAWAEVVDHILRPRETQDNPLLDIRSVAFGAPTHCTEFWTKVSQFLPLCGDRLESLNLNAPVRGIAEHHFPALLTEAFMGGMTRQPNLRRATIMWRDDKGLDADSIAALLSLAPSLEFLHVCQSYPIQIGQEQQINTLVEQFKHFSKLRELHLVFPTFLAVEETRNAYSKLNTSISNNGELLQTFWRDIAQAIPCLEEVSWSTYEANIVLNPRYRHSGRASYVKLVRDVVGSEVANPEDQLRVHRDFESEESCRHPCMVGSKRFLLGQKPGWRVDMGNPVKDKICDHPEIDAVDNVSTTIANYHEL